MSVERIIGIDFGTSTSVMRVKRYMDGAVLGERLDVKEVTFNSMGQSLVPTLIRKIQGKEPYYGFDAQKEHKKSTLFANFKVNLESSDPQEKAQARALTEEFFVYLAKQYRDQSSGGFFGEADETERTLISYPVKWSEETRRFMLEAAKKAGFKNVEGMDEAQAAITAVMVQSADYLSQRGYLRDGVPANILMADMGAGTTDLVLCRYTPGKSAQYEILSAWPREGGTLFGGREVEEMLQDYLRGLLPEEDADIVMKRCGLSKFKSWKEDYVSPALGRDEAVTEFYEFDERIEDLEIEIEEYAMDRNGFEKMAADYLQGFPMLVNGCLKDAGLSGDAVDLMLLTGGHSQWYFVREQLCGRLNQFGAIGLGKIQADPERIIPVPRPQETVALGLVYGPLAREVRFAGKDKSEIPPGLEKARVRVTETLQQEALKNREKTDSQSGQEWSEAEQMAQYYGLEYKPDSAGKLSRASGSGSNTELEVWDESMRVLPVTPEEEFEFRKVGGTYEVEMGVRDKQFYQIPYGYEVERYLGNRDIVSIPAQYRGQSVVAIGAYAFSKRFGNALKLREVEIPGSCRMVNEFAFRNGFEEVSLNKVILHPGVRMIGRWAFGDNEELSALELPDGLVAIGMGAFSGCGLNRIFIPASCKKIWNAFFHNSALSEVIFSADAQIEWLHERAFAYTDVRQITLPRSCKCEKLVRKLAHEGEKGGLFKKAKPATLEELITIKRY